MQEQKKAQPTTTRPYQERFLDGFDRSQLRREVQKVKPSPSKRRKKYMSWALGASLAVGSIGAPVLHQTHDRLFHRGQPAPQPDQEAAPESGAASQGIRDDLQIAQNIAMDVAGGVASAARGLEHGVEQAAGLPLAAVAAAPEALAAAPAEILHVAEAAKASFFAREVPFGSIIYSEARKNNLEPALVAAIVQQESRFKPTARSHMGAVGLMQLVPKTGRWMGATNLLNPAQNIKAGAKYLRYLHDQFNGNETKVIAAYNAGEGNVRRFGGVPPFRETRKYVSRVQDFQQQYSDRMQSQIAELRPPPAR